MSKIRRSREELRSALDEFCQKTGQTDRVVGHKLFGDRQFFPDVLKRGRGCSIDKFDTAMNYFAHEAGGAS